MKQTDAIDREPSTVYHVSERRLVGHLQGLDLRNALEEFLRYGVEKVIVDLACVEFISSAAVGTLVRANQDYWAQDSRLVLANVRPEVLEILRVTRVHELFEILTHDRRL